jgi:DNA repair exonuclease SbcCD ATPase subunit
MLLARFKNLLAWGSKPVEIDLTTQGLIAVKGKHLSSSAKSSNGCGKSTILNSIVWVLYGEYPAKYKKSDMINENAKKDCLSECWITRNGKEGYIVRGISCTPATYSHNNGDSIEIEGDFTLFFIDGKDCRGIGTKTTQDSITNFIGLDCESFITAALFANSAESFASKTSGKQEELFSKLLHLEDLEIARQKVKDKTKEVKDEISTCDIEINKFKSHIDRENDRLSKVSDNVAKWQTEQQNKLSVLAQNVGVLESRITEHTASITLTKNELEEAQEALEDLQDEIKGVNEEGFKAAKTAALNVLREIDSELGSVKGEIRTLKGDITQAQGMYGKATCPKCFNEVTEEHLYEIIDEKNKRVDELELDLEKKNNKRIKEHQSLIEAENSLSKVNSRRNEIVAQSSLISRLTGKLQSAEKDRLRDTETLQQTVERIGRLKLENPPQAEDSKNIELEVIRLNNEIELQESSRLELNNQLEDLDFWAVGFGPTGIRNLLVRSVIPELNKHANRFVDILTGGEVEIEFTGETEIGTGRNVQNRNKLEVKITDRHGSDKYYKESSGEMRRIDMAIAIAMNFLIASRVGLSFIIMDEVFASLDNAGQSSVMDLLEELRKDIPTILIISNQDTVLNDNFDETWVVCRKGKESYIEKE